MKIFNFQFSLFNLKPLWIFLSVIFCQLLFVSPVYAHVLKTDGNIGAVLHVDPQDDPIAGEQTGFFFEFKDKTNRFKPEDCDCTFTISEDGREIFSQPLFANSATPSLTSASLFFAFPEKNVYQIKVSGKPRSAGEFDNFTLVYDVRVARETGAKTNIPVSNWVSTHVIHLVGAFAILAFMIFAIIKQRTS